MIMKHGLVRLYALNVVLYCLALLIGARWRKPWNHNYNTLINILIEKYIRIFGVGMAKPILFGTILNDGKRTIFLAPRNPVRIFMS